MLKWKNADSTQELKTTCSLKSNQSGARMFEIDFREWWHRALPQAPNGLLLLLLFNCCSIISSSVDHTPKKKEKQNLYIYKSNYKFTFFISISGVSNCRFVATGASKHVTNQKLKALFKTGILFAKHDQLNIYKILHLNYFWCNLYSKTSELHLSILSIDWYWS